MKVRACFPDGREVELDCHAVANSLVWHEEVGPLVIDSADIFSLDNRTKPKTTLRHEFTADRVEDGTPVYVHKETRDVTAETWERRKEWERERWRIMFGKEEP
jgi:hypothetical protein